jgi:hypothetical protein
MLHDHLSSASGAGELRPHNWAAYQADTASPRDRYEYIRGGDRTPAIQAIVIY